MAEVSLTKEVLVSQKDFYQVVSDYEKYPEFLTEIKSVNVKSKKRVAFTLELIKTFHYVLEFKEESPKSISWKLVDSNLFKKNTGGWKIEKKNGLTSVTYTLNVEFGFFAPSLLINQMVKRDLPNMIDRVVARVESLKGTV